MKKKVLIFSIFFAYIFGFYFLCLDKVSAKELTPFKENGYSEITTELIEEASKIDGIKRIRLGSLEPNIITKDFMERLKNIKEFCPHFHLSLQSGCDETLKRMNRKYTANEYYEKVCLIREYYPHAAMTTDVITGFPGETEEEFAITKEFLEKINFYEVHLFKYSVRQGTVAEKMPNQCTDKVKGDRLKVLEKDGMPRKEAFMNYYIDKEDLILLEETQVIDGQEYAVGYNEEYVKMAIPSKDYTGPMNEIVKVRAVRKLNDELLLSILQ